MNTASRRPSERVTYDQLLSHKQSIKPHDQLWDFRRNRSSGQQVIAYDTINTSRITTNSVKVIINTFLYVIVCARTYWKWSQAPANTFLRVIFGRLDLPTHHPAHFTTNQRSTEMAHGLSHSPHPGASAGDKQKAVQDRTVSK